MAIIPSLEPDADNCKLHNSYDVQSCILAGVSLLLGTAVCFYGKQKKKHFCQIYWPSFEQFAVVDGRSNLPTHNSPKVLKSPAKDLGVLANNSF